MTVPLSAERRAEIAQRRDLCRNHSARFYAGESWHEKLADSITDLLAEVDRLERERDAAKLACVDGDLSEAISRLSDHITLPDKMQVYVRDVSLLIQAAKECAALRVENERLKEQRNAWLGAAVDQMFGETMRDSVGSLRAENERLTACLNSIYPSIAGRASVLRGAGETNAAAEWCAVADKIVAAMATPQPINREASE